MVLNWLITGAILHITQGWLRWCAGVAVLGFFQAERGLMKILALGFEERMACDTTIPGFGRANAARGISCAIRISVTETEDGQRGVSLWKNKNSSLTNELAVI